MIGSKTDFSPTSAHKAEKPTFFSNVSLLSKIHWEDFKKWQSPEKFYHKLTNIKFGTKIGVTNKNNNKKKTEHNHLHEKKENNKKYQPLLKELDFYLDILRRLELLKFSAEFVRNNNENKEINVSFQNMRIESVHEQKCFDSISNNLGKNYFCNFYRMNFMFNKFL